MIQQKIKQIYQKQALLNEQLLDVNLINDRKSYIEIARAHKRGEEIITLHQQYEKTLKTVEDTLSFLKEQEDAEIRQLAKDELATLQTKIKQLENALHDALVTKDVRDEKNAIIELRAGTGGDEAAIWVGDLFRMYTRLAERKGWNLQVVDFTDGSSGGYKEIIATVEGDAVYGELKYESGVHRVQRVPDTETQGRIHTSAASLVVLPEAAEVDVKLDMNEIRKDTFCASGPGGQSVNTTYSAIRLTHLPTGITVSCQNNKSQIRNFEEALVVLRSRLYEKALISQQKEVGLERKSMIGSGDRSDKIRTYNYPQSRVTDHRINLTLHNLSSILDGELDTFIQQLKIVEKSSQN